MIKINDKERINEINNIESIEKLIKEAKELYHELNKEKISQEKYHKKITI